MDIKKIDFKKLFESIYIFESKTNNLNKFKYQNEIQILKNILNQAKILSNKYDIVITNPPYMGNSGMNPNLKDYLKKNFPNSKSDLFAVFIEKCHDFSKSNGFIAMITQQSFMFLSTFEKLRVDFINTHTIIDMAHLGAHAFEEIGGEVVQATSFINSNKLIENYNTTFHKLTEFNSESKKEQEFLNDKNNFIKNQSIFEMIPGNPIAYWMEDNMFKLFKNKDLSNYGEIISGIVTGNTNLYIRFWFEVNFNKIPFKSKMEDIDLNSQYWIPYTKGGERRNWYGNNDCVVNWSEKDNFSRSKTTCTHLYLKKGLTWSLVTSGRFSIRYFDEGFLWDSAGPSAFFNDELIYYILALLSTNLINDILSLINPTINMPPDAINKIPLIIDNSRKKNIITISKKNIELSKKDWDNYELSWDFKTHPFIEFNKCNSLKEIFSIWATYKQNLFNQSKNNEVYINKQFNEIYNVNSNDNISNKHVSIKIANYEEDMKSFISYAVGCMFGRYSLDSDGLEFAGGEFNITNYRKFVPDDDNIIPVLDSEYFEDDIVGKFVEFVKTCFGEETLEENLDFIANALAKNKKPSREKIREYLLKNFFNDHKKMYKKTPIYWQFNSGKQNGFNCLVYMHRYEPSLVARIRTDYLHKTQKAIEQAISNCDNIIDHSSSNTEIARATKDKTKLQKQLQETQEYDEALAHIANQNIEIDLDDGVKVNYAKFQNIEVSREGKKSKKINLLKKL